MTAPGYRHAHVRSLRAIPPVRDSDPAAWIPVRRRLGISAFGINAFAGDAPGAILIECHDEINTEGVAAHEEAYLVLEGEVEFTIAGDTFRAGAGEVVTITDPALVREARATVAPALVVAVGAAPGVVYEVSPWERRELAARDENGR